MWIITLKNHKIRYLRWIQGGSGIWERDGYIALGAWPMCKMQGVKHVLHALWRKEAHKAIESQGIELELARETTCRVTSSLFTFCRCKAGSLSLTVDIMDPSVIIIIINVHLLVCWVKLRLSTRVGTTALKTTIYLRRKIVHVKKGNGMTAKVVGGWVNYLLK